MTRRPLTATAAVLIAAALMLIAQDERPPTVVRPHDDATDTYEVQKIEGWTVRVSRRYAGHEDEKQAVLDEVRVQLRRVALLVRPEPLEKLRKVEVWVEYDYPGRCQYHPGRPWLIRNKYNPDKVKTVEIANATEFLGWRTRPVMTLLHELAHAYHDQVLGFDDPRIIQAYEKAKESGAYDSVIRDRGGEPSPHYAMTNHKEYFAECTEAYLWSNDWFPFVYGELRQVDPEMAELLEEVWGKRK